MGGLFGGSKPISSSTPRISTLQINNSNYMGPIPIVYGRRRIPNNLLHFTDFISIKRKTRTGGKGGGSFSSVDYLYKVAVLLGLCEGPIDSVIRIWNDKIVHPAPSDLGLTTFTGAIGQAAWGYMTTMHPTEALGYSGIAYVARSDFDLGTTPSLPNLSFEVATMGGVDMPAADFTADFLGNTKHGVQFPLANIGPLTVWRDYTIAYGLLLSAALVEQKPARDWLTQWLKLTNTEVVWSDGLLKFVPYGDESRTANGATFTADTSPVYDLNEDDFKNGIKWRRNDTAEGYRYRNHFQIEYLNRARDYNTEPAEYKDQANILLYGIRTQEPLQAHEVCDGAVAQRVVFLRGQRLANERKTYDFSLGQKHMLLEPMDLVSLTYPALGYDHLPVRVVSTAEGKDGSIDVMVEEFIQGNATAEDSPYQQALGYIPNNGVTSGDAFDPVIFEPPYPLLVSKPEVWVAISGGANWGGCEVWASADNLTYERVGQIEAGARYGATTTAITAGPDFDTTQTLGVLLNPRPPGESAFQLLGGALINAKRFLTLSYLGGEFISYQDSTMTAANAFNLTNLQRAGYGTKNKAHAIGTSFVRVDGAVFKYRLRGVDVGDTIYLKFLSFNIFSQSRQELSDVTAYPYIIRGNSLPYVAAVAIAAYRAITLDSAGLAIYADNAAGGTADVILGVSLAAAGIGDEVVVQQQGPVTNAAWTWTGNGVIYVDTASGNLTQTRPVAPAQIIPVGYALKATEMYVY